MAIGDKKPVVMQSDRAVPGGVASLGADGKIPAGQIPVIPIESGGTGANHLIYALQNFGINVPVSIGAGEAVTITLPRGGVYLIGISDNVRTGVLMVTVLDSTVGTIQTLIPLINWSCVKTDNALSVTLAETSGHYPMSIGITTLIGQPGVLPYLGG